MAWLPQLLYQSYLFLSDLVISLLILEAWVELVMHLSALAPTKKTKKQTLFLKAQYPITWVCTGVKGVLVVSHSALFPSKLPFSKYLEQFLAPGPCFTSKLPLLQHFLGDWTLPFPKCCTSH